MKEQTQFSREMKTIGFPDWADKPVQTLSLEIETQVDGTAVRYRIEGLLPTQLDDARSWIEKRGSFPDVPAV
jgi:hypothetical protein